MPKSTSPLDYQWTYRFVWLLHLVYIAQKWWKGTIWELTSNLSTINKRILLKGINIKGSIVSLSKKLYPDCIPGIDLSMNLQLELKLIEGLMDFWKLCYISSRPNQNICDHIVD